MFSLAQFSSSHKQQSSKVDRSVGVDGYRACDRAVVCAFQQFVEREAGCDYDALRVALLKARDPQFVVTLVNLRRAYNDSLYASAGYVTVKGN